MFSVCLFTETGISVMHKDDKRKEDFCKRFMGVDWADMTKYNLCLDNGTLGYKKCVEEIESALEILKK